VAALLEPFEEKVGEEERGEVVDGEGPLESVGGDVAGIPVAADVVDQDVNAGSCSSASAASRRTSDWVDSSATKTSTVAPVAERISAAVCCARAACLPVIATFAPILASPRAVALPIPPVPPVISTVLPVIGLIGRPCSSVGLGRR
jgi:hypothetical protein